MPRKVDLQTGATAIILLAAGASTRLGRPKQLVLWNGEPLLRHSTIVALSARLGPVIVVLGAVERECRKSLAGLSVEIVVNTSWTEGMGGSIATGMIPVQNSVTPLQSVIIMLCDHHTSARQHFARSRTNSDARDPPWSHRIIAKATTRWGFPPSSHLRDLQRSLNSAERSAPNN
jgi:CTP:molybdopterin cytidylyltransferase MocA